MTFISLAKRGDRLRVRLVTRAQMDLPKREKHSTYTHSFVSC